jgi:hypothetical protein
MPSAGTLRVPMEQPCGEQSVLLKFMPIGRLHAPWRKPVTGSSPSPVCRHANDAAPALPMRSNDCTSSSERSRRVDCDTSRDDAEFTWQGFNEMDEASGDGGAELQPDGSLHDEISFRNGHERTLKARRSKSTRGLPATSRSLIAPIARGKRYRRPRSRGSTRRLQRCAKITAPERTERSDDADRGQADLAFRSRCALDGHERQWQRARRLQCAKCRGHEASSHCCHEVTKVGSDRGQLSNMSEQARTGIPFCAVSPPKDKTGDRDDNQHDRRDGHQISHPSEQMRPSPVLYLWRVRARLTRLGL